MHSTLVEEYFEEIKKCSCHGNILDLACGEGRNGLFLAQQGLPVTFADHSDTALKKVTDALNTINSASQVWSVDLEKPGINPFEKNMFSTALVFRYLHRPLIPRLMDAITPGGIIIYETFTTENRQFGRPNNPDFLLQPKELEDWFKTWETLHYFEGILPSPDRAIAQIVCRKPS